MYGNNIATDDDVYATKGTAMAQKTEIIQSGGRRTRKTVICSISEMPKIPNADQLVMFITLLNFSAC